MQHVYPFLPLAFTTKIFPKCPKAVMFKKTEDKPLTSCSTVNKVATTVLDL